MNFIFFFKKHRPLLTYHSLKYLRLERAVVRSFGQEENLFYGQGLSTSFKLQEANPFHGQGVSTSFEFQEANDFHREGVSTSFK